MAVNAHAPRPRLQPRGLAVWLQPCDGQDIDPAVWAQAASAVLARARQLAPEAEVQLWTDAGNGTAGGEGSGGRKCSRRKCGRRPCSRRRWFRRRFTCRRCVFRKCRGRKFAGRCQPASVPGRAAQHRGSGSGPGHRSAGRRSGQLHPHGIQPPAVSRGEPVPPGSTPGTAGLFGVPGVPRRGVPLHRRLRWPHPTQAGLGPVRRRHGAWWRLPVRARDRAALSADRRNTASRQPRFHFIAFISLPAMAGAHKSRIAT